MGAVPLMRVIFEVVVAFKIMGAIAGVDFIFILACEAARVTDATAMKKHFKFAQSTKSDKDGRSLSSSFQTGLFIP